MNARRVSSYVLIGVGTASVVALGLTPVAPISPAAADGLAPFADCEELRDWYVAKTLPKVTAWGLGHRYPRYAIADGFRLAGPTPTAGFSLDVAAAASSDSGTNVQEAGVDEPDIAKSNGVIAAIVDDNVIEVTDVSGNVPMELSSVELDAREGSAELLLVDEMLVVVQHDRSMAASWQRPFAPPIGPEAVRVQSDWFSASVEGGSQSTTVTLVDLSDPAEPQVQSTKEIDGAFITAREYEGIVRLVVRHQPSLGFAHPMAKEGMTRAEALTHNRNVVLNSLPAVWLPTITDSGGTSRPLVSCDQVRHPTSEGSASGSIAIATFDPNSGETWATTGVTADGDLVYSSLTRLYVGQSDGNGSWSPVWSPSGRDEAITSIHAFDVTDDRTTYVASGAVPGIVPDRWALSEDDGYLRVAATQYDDWTAETHVAVFAEREGDLVETGTVGGIGEGEDIQSVRWFGDVAVVVTFQQVDPLYTLDLSDPTSPKILGELKIPGFSAYLHPLGNDTLLGVGQAGTQQGWLTGSAVSTFDLSNLAEPIQLASMSLGGRHSSSPVERDSRTFTYLPDPRVAFVPVGDWHGGGAIVAVEVDADGGVSRKDTYQVGNAETARAIALGADRVAIVAYGQINLIVDLSD